MRRERFYISTIAADDAKTARTYGLGLEIAEYCTASNMDEQFAETHAAVERKLQGVCRRILHGPFNELFPCAIDPKARELARCRYRQAAALAQQYGAEKIVIHGGYNPWLYYPVWYVEQSVLFWREFIQEVPEGLEICLENVLEEEPSMLREIVRQVGDTRLRLCLDVGHVNAYSDIPVMDWLEDWAPYLSHFHIHNNNGDRDSHSPLNSGTMPVRQLLCRAEKLCPDATYTLELTESEPSVRWLLEEEEWKNN